MTSLSLFTFMHWRRKWQPAPVFLPGESQGRRSLVGCCLWGRTESDTTSNLAATVETAASETQSWLLGGSGGWKDMVCSADVEFRVPGETNNLTLELN